MPPPKKAAVAAAAAAPPRSRRVRARDSGDNGDDDDVDVVDDVDDEGSDEGNDMVQELRVMEENLRRSLAVDTGLGKEQKQKRLEKEFESQMVKVEARIDEKVRVYQEKARRDQDAWLDRLGELVLRKAEVERQIVRHSQELAEGCRITTEEFEAVLQGRSHDVHEAIEDLKSASGNAKGGRQ